MKIDGKLRIFLDDALSFSFNQILQNQINFILLQFKSLTLKD